MTTWYSFVSTVAGEGITNFSGFFSVNNDNPTKVTSFYETINGSTNFNNNIFANNTLNGADNVFVKGGAFAPKFSTNGTNITSIYIYRNVPGAASFKFYSGIDGVFTEGSRRLNIYNSSGVILYNIQSYFDINPIADPSCYNEGTKILCLNKQLAEEYIAIELLRKGDLVKSYKHGYRRVDLIGKDSMINNPERFNQSMYKMEKTAENGLLEDLIVTGGHVLLVDDLGEYKEKNDKIFGSTPMIDDKYLLLAAISKDFKKIDSVSLYTYYHFTLENNGNDDERFGVWANGILSETVSKKQFMRHKYILL